MTEPKGSAAATGFLAGYKKIVIGLTYALLVISGVALLAMIAVVSIDVVLRAFRMPMKGADDLIRITGAITIAGALPYTTAVKGHVAIEFLFLKLRRRGRVVVDTLARLVTISLFSVLAWEGVRYGESLRAASQVSPTLKVPMFWIPYILALSCGVVVLVTVYHLVRPGKAMIAP